MSRDQKPAKVRLVAGAPVNYGRRAEDRVPSEAMDALPAETAAEMAPASRKGPTLVLALLFLVACAMGGAGTVFLGLAGIGTP